MKIANEVATFLRNCNEFARVHKEVEVSLTCERHSLLDLLFPQRHKNSLNKYMSEIKVVYCAIMSVGSYCPFVLYHQYAVKLFKKTTLSYNIEESLVNAMAVGHGKFKSFISGTSSTNDSQTS